ncbi:sulfotransferase family 2 domain-containing protein [Paraburkholderia kururiensis]|uniref:sulfotransferase family 2 domain-containing protein n=1 Tax=Paraburkholderia kururiensis TaxID=984307 RepID=UPI000F89A0A5|nr:sulfotransferase family 2 domain-containing protein [Paraburkholderia kururiensis]
MDDDIYYLHIPKTGGSSFISFLDAQFRAADVCPAQLLPQLFDIPGLQLADYRFFRGHLWYGLNTYLKRPLRYITLLRDPVQRTISWYSHVKREVGAYRHHDLITRNWSLLDFVRDEQTNWDMINAQTLFLAVDLDYSALSRDPVGYGQAIVKQYAHRGNDQKLLNIAKRRLEQCACFGITERMDDSINLISYAMNFYPNFWPQKLNVGTNRPSAREISSEVIAAINEITELDRKLYNWACEVFDDRFSLMVKSLLDSHYRSRCEHPRGAWRGPLPADERKRFQVGLIEAPCHIAAAERFEIKVTIANRSFCEAGDSNANPVNISYHWRNAADGTMVVFDGQRTAISPPLLVGEKRDFRVIIVAPVQIGKYILRLTLVQEGVAWFDEAESSVFVDCEVVIG